MSIFQTIKNQYIFRVEEFKDYMLSLKQVPGDADEIENEDLLFNPSHYKAKRLVSFIAHLYCFYFVF